MDSMHRMLLWLSILLSATTFAGTPTSQPFEGVRYWHELHSDPVMSLYIVQVDLKNPNISIRVSPAGKDPDGDGEWQTVLMPPSEIAKREHFDVCVNASFFIARNTKDAEGAASGYVAGKWASAEGYAMTDGKLWSSVPRKAWPMFFIDDHARARFLTAGPLPQDAKQAVQGNAFVLLDNKVLEPKSEVMKARHPRTVIGMDRDGNTLTILTVDGRRPGVSIGMTGPELGEEMKRLGCDTAMNLDGGGSSELVLRDAETGKLMVMNQPSDGRERAVADVLGVQIHESQRHNSPAEK